MYREKNLRRKLELTLGGFNFIEVKRKLFVYPDSLEMNVVTRFILLRKELHTLEAASDEDKTLVSTTKIIRNELKGLKDELPWPPKSEHLNIEMFTLPSKLNLFLQTLLAGKYAQDDSPRVARLTLSFGQDLIYDVTHGNVKTPKSILFPYQSRH